MMNMLQRKKWRKNLLYIPLAGFAIFYLIPMYVMLVTGFKGFDEVSLKTMWDLPSQLQIENFTEALNQLAPNLINTLTLVLPSAIISSILGSINGYVLAKWKFKGSEIIFPLILFGMAKLPTAPTLQSVIAT